MPGIEVGDVVPKPTSQTHWATGVRILEFQQRHYDNGYPAEVATNRRVAFC
jgi:hypothetical protein